MSRERIKHGMPLTLLRDFRPVRTLLVGATVAAFTTLLPVTAAAELSPAIQTDLYLVQIEEYWKQKNYGAALETAEKLIKLAKEHKSPVAARFHFRHAEILNAAGKYAEASVALHRYLESAGQEGAHYVEALYLLHEVSEAVAAPQVGTTFRDCDSCPEMITVSSGNYQMGSPSSEADRDDDEGPVHRVTIPRPFAVGVYEVTFAEWDVCVDSGGCGGHRPDDEGWGRGRLPVINVSWEDAQRYVAWLRQGTGQEYRLISESEWEYVARAGTKTPRHWGDRSNSQCQYANGADETAKKYNSGWTVANCDDGHYRTASVGSFDANAYGLYDVLGNVWEWVQDCWNDSYRGAPSDGSAWERGDCGRRVLRGGSWNGRAEGTCVRRFAAGINPGSRNYRQRLSGCPDA